MNWTAALIFFGAMFILAAPATDSAKQYAAFALVGVVCLLGAILTL